MGVRMMGVPSGAQEKVGPKGRSRGQMGPLFFRSFDRVDDFT